MPPGVGLAACVGFADGLCPCAIGRMLDRGCAPLILVYTVDQELEGTAQNYIATIYGRAKPNREASTGGQAEFRH
jgi:hypothetical protein